MQPVNLDTNHHALPLRPDTNRFALPNTYFCAYHVHINVIVMIHCRMLRKESLGQDMLLIGPPNFLRRELALAFCNLINRAVEYVPITRDTTESDLKQRREIVGNSSIYLDQAAVRAAVNGRVLLLDGYVSRAIQQTTTTTITTTEY
jgi:hypothetical protein